MSKASEIKFAVFRDDKGNRFVFPSIFDDGEDHTINWGLCRSLVFAIGIEEEPERLVVKRDEAGALTLPHVKSDMAHPGFQHGAATVWLISGPTFDEIAKEEAAA